MNRLMDKGNEQEKKQLEALYTSLSEKAREIIKELRTAIVKEPAKDHWFTRLCSFFRS